MTKLVYLAGPMAGLTNREASKWRQDAAEILAERGIGTLSPLRGLGHEGPAVRIDTEPMFGALSDRGVITRDYSDVRRADVVLCNLKGAKRVSIGAVSEIAWCYAHRIPLVVVMNDHIGRDADQDLHDHPFIREAATYVTLNMQHALALTCHILAPGTSPHPRAEAVR